MDILPDLRLKSRENVECLYLSSDDPAYVKDINWFNSYPYQFKYSFNSRGFRDAEWPHTVEELKNSIWCFGDSAVTGVGAPVEHSWPYVLQSVTGSRTINISMDGASNEWIARRAAQVIAEIDPKNIIIMWTYLHRRESKDHTQSDEARRIWHTKCSDDADLENFKQCVVPFLRAGIQNYTISEPNQYSSWLSIWDEVKGPDWPSRPQTTQEFLQLPKWICDELKKFGVYKKLSNAISTDEPFNRLCRDLGINPITEIDKARDGYHFDVLTSTQIAKTMAQNIVL